MNAMPFDVNAARRQMVDQQIRAWSVLDERVLDALERVRREDFVPPAYRQLAFGDIAIPLAHGQCMLNPKTEGKLLQALLAQSTDKVLLVGAGSGHVAACLGLLADKVQVIEFFPDIADTARRNLQAVAANNVAVEVGDAMQLDVNQQYDAIALTASLPVYDERFERALKVGGRLFVVVGTNPGEALRITRTAEHSFTRESLFDTELPALTNAPRPAAFVF